MIEKININVDYKMKRNSTTILEHLNTKLFVLGCFNDTESIF